MATKRSYIVGDGEMMLTLEPAEEGGYVVTSPLDPELITEAESLEEGFENARAAQALNESRERFAKQLAVVNPFLPTNLSRKCLAVEK